MTEQSYSSKRVQLEKAFKVTASSDLQLSIVKYLKLLRDQRYSRLLNTDENNSVDKLIGELRCLQKLLSVLELGGSPALADSLPDYQPSQD